MKAISIALRIADFLKLHPPFNFLDPEDLVELTAAGRVKFHEAGEVIFSQGQPRGQYIFVINDGRVRIVEETAKGSNLIDLRGVGDLLGLQGVLSDEPYINTGITETDVLLYALPRERFAALTEKSPPAQRYLAAYFSLNPAYGRKHHAVAGRFGVDDGLTAPTTLRKGGLIEVDPPQRIARETLFTVGPEVPAREAARHLRSKRIHCIVVVDAEGRPLGKLTDGDLRDRFIEGRTEPDATVGDLMFRDLAYAKPQDDTGKLMVRLTRSGKRFLIVTEDGTAATPVVGLVAERNLFLQYGRFPTLLGEAMSEAPDFTALRLMRDRVEALILEFLDDRSEVAWLMEMTGVLNRRLTQRVLELAEADLAGEGQERPDLESAWLMMGSGGRDELLIRSAVYHALVYRDPPPGAEDAARAYFRELGRRASEGLRQCGFMESVQGVLARHPEWCLPQSEMHARFSAMIARPHEENVYDARDAFDFRPVEHRSPLARELRQHIAAEISRHPEFIAQMAADSLVNQPPRTIFKDYVVDDQGAQNDELKIKSHALLPLVDAARVFNLAGGDINRTATHRRLRAEARRLQADHPIEADLLNEAAEAFIVAAFARTKQGLLAGTDGAVIQPTHLDAETRTLLKTSFRAILGTLEHLAARFDLALRL